MALRRRLPRGRVLGRSRESRLGPAERPRAASRPRSLRVVFADWQSCSAGGGELLDPSRSQYKEAFIVVNALLDLEEVTTCPFIWVDRDFALTRGWLQGFPKKLGSIWVTRTFGAREPRRPGHLRGATYGATCAAYERRVIEATSRSSGSPRPGRPTTTRRSSTSPLRPPRGRPPRRPGRARARPLAQPRPRLSPVWEGSATLDLFGSRTRSTTSSRRCESERAFASPLATPSTTRRS